MVEIKEKRLPTMEEYEHFLGETKEDVSIKAYVKYYYALFKWWLKQLPTKPMLIKMLPFYIGTFFLLAGLFPLIGSPLLNIFTKDIAYQNMRWFFLFIGVDLIGSLAIPLFFIRLGLIAPFSIYALIAEPLFRCEPVTFLTFQVSANSVVNIGAPCWLQTLAFLLWLLTAIILFVDRFPYLNQVLKVFAIVTQGYVYMGILFVKVFALFIILTASTPLGAFVSAIFAIFIVLMDMFTVSLALRR
jgi:hypothetical protein